MATPHLWFSMLCCVWQCDIIVTLVSWNSLESDWYDKESEYNCYGCFHDMSISPMWELTHWKRPWCWLKAEGKGADRGWDGWMASVTRWTWVWVNSRSWWWTGRPGVLRFMGSQRVGHDWATELNWTELLFHRHYASFSHLMPTKTIWRKLNYHLHF